MCEIKEIKQKFTTTLFYINTYKIYNRIDRLTTKIYMFSFTFSFIYKYNNFLFKTHKTAFNFFIRKICISDNF